MRCKKSAVVLLGLNVSCSAFIFTICKSQGRGVFNPAAEDKNFVADTVDGTMNVKTGCCN